MSVRPSHIFCIKALKAKNHILVAAKHNLREIAAENVFFLKSGCSRKNVVIAGPSSAKEVDKLAEDLKRQAGVLKPRRNAILAVEIVVSLGDQMQIDAEAFFRDVFEWIKMAFAVPVLSAAIHFDEDNPHCHYLLLPLIDNCMRGSTLVGPAMRLMQFQRDLVGVLGDKYGLTVPPKCERLSLAVRNDLAAQIVIKLDQPEIMQKVEVRQALQHQLVEKPQNLAKLLGIPLPLPNSAHSRFVEIMTKDCSSNTMAC